MKILILYWQMRMAEASAYWYKTHDSLAHSTMFFILCPFIWTYYCISFIKIADWAFTVLNSGLNLNSSQKLCTEGFIQIYFQFCTGNTVKKYSNINITKDYRQFYKPGKPNVFVNAYNIQWLCLVKDSQTEKSPKYTWAEALWETSVAQYKGNNVVFPW